MKIIVVSGINLYKGGTLRVIQDCIAALSVFVKEDFHIVALVHNEKLFPVYTNVQYITYPLSRKSWIYRLYYEYIGFFKLSKQLKPYMWISLHDTTPCVLAERRFVYCHNTFVYYRPEINKIFLQPSIFMFSLFSDYIHKINIHKNNYVIVQQEWLRQSFRKKFSIYNIIVSTPVNIGMEDIKFLQKDKIGHKKTIFLYPASPMIHKNFEVICQAALLLEQEKMNNFEVILTFNGNENRYSRNIFKCYKSMKSLSFVGFLGSEDMHRYYSNCDVLIFSSKIESWGLPITEAKKYSKPIFVSNLPYAKETVGEYDKVKFFNPNDVLALSILMKNFIEKNICYDLTKKTIYEQPFARNWDELLHLLFA